MLALILNFLGGSFAKSLAAAYEAKQKAATDQERIAADERISRLEQIAAIQKAEAGSRINAIIRAGFALPFVIYNAKLVLWDKVLALGVTDGLSAELVQIEIACIGFYFLRDATVSVAGIIKRK